MEGGERLKRARERSWGSGDLLRHHLVEAIHLCEELHQNTLHLRPEQVPHEAKCSEGGSAKAQARVRVAANDLAIRAGLRIEALRGNRIDLTQAGPSRPS